MPPRLEPGKIEPMKTRRNRPSYADVLAASDAALLAACKRDRLSDAKWSALQTQVIDMVAYDAACVAFDAACVAAADAYDRSCDVAEAYHA